jgi:hypothetical protein
VFVSTRTNINKKGAKLFFLIAGLAEFPAILWSGIFRNSGNTVPLEAKNQKEVPTVYNGFLDLTHLFHGAVFLFKTVPHP